MKQLSLRDRLMRYMENHHSEWIPSGELQRIVAANTTYTPRTTVRRLEELANEGTLEVKYVKGHAHYRAAQSPNYIQWAKQAVEQFDKDIYLQA